MPKNPKQHQHTPDEALWPKLMTAQLFAKRWYVDRTKESVINDIKRGNLPGYQDPNNTWYVWVNADRSPALNFEGPQFPTSSTPEYLYRADPGKEPAKLTGNPVADEILKRHYAKGEKQQP